MAEVSDDGFVCSFRKAKVEKLRKEKVDFEDKAKNCFQPTPAKFLGFFRA